MIGLILIIFIGKSYYQLAKKFNKTGWPYVILGIVSYYASAFIFGIILGFVDIVMGTNIIDGTSDILLGILGLPIGILTCWFVYKQLEKSWSKDFVPPEPVDEQIQNFGSKEDDLNFEK